MCVSVCVHARRVSTDDDEVIHMLSSGWVGGLCVCVFVNSCIFSLATQTWQALAQRSDGHRDSLSTG